MRIVKLDQGTPEWLAWRHGGVGSSDAPIILGTSPWTTRTQLLEEKVTGVPSRKQNSAMKRGHDLEPIARALYEELMGVCVSPVCGEGDGEDSWMRVSLDGWEPSGRTSLEIKAPNRDDHALALEDKVPEKYQPQCDWQLLVSGASIHHYVSYNPKSFSGSRKFALVPWPRNEEAIAVLCEAAREFWRDVLEERRRREISDPSTT